jgi:uncharacterized protein
MKILAVSDEIAPGLYGPGLTARAGDVDLVISCGDLPLGYLEFLASTLSAPCFFVRGNHDTPTLDEQGGSRGMPDGWTNLDGRVARGHNRWLAGLEGCVRYKPGAPLHYSQREQSWRMALLAAKMATRRPDIFVAHAPPHGIHNGKDPAHAGFRAYNWLIDTFQPRLFLHGHQHRNYNLQQVGETVVGGTLVVNVHPYRVLELPD